MDRTPDRSHRARVGDLEIVVVSDGPLNVGRASDVLARDPDDPAGPPATEEMLLAQNALALRSGAGWVLFETGLSSLDDHDGAGRLPSELAAAGIAAADVRALVPSHGHLDHVGGIMSRTGDRNFPEAAIHLVEAELAFWLSDDRLGGASERSARVARANLLPNLDRVLHHRDGSELLLGVLAMHTPGHTVGHASFLVSSGREQLFIAGDLAHHQIQIEHPAIGTRFDADPAMAAASRARMLDFLATTRTPALFYHFAWPGLGHVEKRGSGYRFVLAPPAD